MFVLLVSSIASVSLFSSIVFMFEPAKDMLLEVISLGHCVSGSVRQMIFSSLF